MPKKKHFIVTDTETTGLDNPIVFDLGYVIATRDSIVLERSFLVREKSERIGRNPKTGEEVPITPRTVMVFKPSNLLKKAVLDGNSSKS